MGRNEKYQYQSSFVLLITILFGVVFTFLLSSCSTKKQSIAVPFESVEKANSGSETSNFHSDIDSKSEISDAVCYWNGRRFSPGARICVGGWQGPGRGQLHTCTKKGNWYNNFIACP